MISYFTIFTKPFSHVLYKSPNENKVYVITSIINTYFTLYNDINYTFLSELLQLRGIKVNYNDMVYITDLSTTYEYSMNANDYLFGIVMWNRGAGRPPNPLH